MLKLSEAVLHWLQYQRCIGVDQFLNESALTIPIVGYLTSVGWKTEKETDYWRICDKTTKDKCYADFYFTHQDKRRLVLQTKLFKGSVTNKIFDDLVRLALPVDGSIERLLLIAFNKEKKLWGHFKALLELPEKEIGNVDPIGVTFQRDSTIYPLAYNKMFSQIREFTSENLSGFCVRCEARQSSNNYDVVMFSVSRHPIAFP